MVKIYFTCVTFSDFLPQRPTHYLHLICYLPPEEFGYNQELAYLEDCKRWVKRWNLPGRGLPQVGHYLLVNVLSMTQVSFLQYDMLNLYILA
jgi:hypothetical protein